MPLDEEGAKWSCEPCIRGHRSSKCQHFDRLMMKVPKAGRPLAKCPHPKGSCSCQKLYAFMVRIPKGSTCLCRPVYKVPADSTDASRSTAASPTSLTPPSAPSRVQKNGRRQSHFQADPENVSKALESIIGIESRQEKTGIPKYGSTFNDNLYSLPSIFDPPIPATRLSSFSNSGSATHQWSSGCLVKSEPLAQDQSHQPWPGEKNSTSDSDLETEPPHTGPLQIADTVYNKILSVPQISHWREFDAPKQARFSLSLSRQQLPAQAQAPEYLPECELNASRATSNSDLQSQSTLSVTNSAQRPMNLLPTDDHQNFMYCHSQGFDDSYHDCKCGNECQCLGCASHPFNNTTRRHIQEMGALVSLEGGEPSPEIFSDYHNRAPHGLSNTNSVDYSLAGVSSINYAHPSTSQTHPGQAMSPDRGNGYPSPQRCTSEQQLMAPSEYYTLEYPVGLLDHCINMTDSCQCGNGCGCAGCQTHSGHDGIELEPIVLQNPPAYAMELSSLALEQPGCQI